jgi:CHASE2 domain-containing sensor protein
MPAHNPIQRLARFFLLPLSSLSDRLGTGSMSVWPSSSAVAVRHCDRLDRRHEEQGLRSHHEDAVPASAADPEIVIVDIDEPALAAMAPEFGRWPAA